MEDRVPQDDWRPRLVEEGAAEVDGEHLEDLALVGVVLALGVHGLLPLDVFADVHGELRGDVVYLQVGPGAAHLSARLCLDVLNRVHDRRQLGDEHGEHDHGDDDVGEGEGSLQGDGGVDIGAALHLRRSPMHAHKVADRQPVVALIEALGYPAVFVAVPANPIPCASADMDPQQHSGQVERDAYHEHRDHRVDPFERAGQELVELREAQQPGVLGGAEVSDDSSAWSAVGSGVESDPIHNHHGRVESKPRGQVFPCDGAH
mmetsp:Transcript_94426/g.238082  ORF Transcript_94426/g.238082 Transcript_94426/m.238082 type:complete len:261 (+) Transcript_94426:332-1114(+)